MPTRRSLEHDAAVSRRLAQLGEELSAHRGGVRPARGEPLTDPAPAPWWDDHTRLAPRSVAVPPPPEPPSLTAPDPALPMRGRRPLSGRHAAPRQSAGLALGPAYVAVVAVVVALGLALTCWWLVRGRADPAPELAAAPAPGLVTSSPGLRPVDDPTATPAADPAPGTVTVDVTGKVRHPGIAVLDAGARVVDALAAAGGARPGVDLSALNQARVLVDGEQVLVGLPAASGLAAAAAPTPGSSPPATLVDLNTATEAELDTLPDVGPVTAAAILQWRDEHGGFTSVDELLEVDGIGEATLAKLAPLVTV